MSLEEFKTNVKEYCLKLENELNTISSKLEHKTRHSLHSKTIRGRKVLFDYDGKKQKYVKASDSQRIKKLEEECYFAKLINSIEKELSAFKRILNILERTKAHERVFFELPSEKRSLIKPFEFIGNESNLICFSKKKPKSRVETSSFKTVNGELVRSKSELIIADRFKSENIPYHYEPPKFLNDSFEIWHPDFLVMNRRTGDEYYWEHFGMMDNQEYCANAQYKIEQYAKNGIILGKNLIITMESSNHVLNTEYVDTLIEKFLL